MPDVSSCSLTQDQFRGWKAVYLKNEWVSLVAVPDIGGRIMAYDLGNYPYLYVDPALAGQLFTPTEHQGDGSLAAWKNYGGDKTWPAPQGWDTDDQWHGPPDPLLDSGCYKITGMESSRRMVCLTMTSPADPRTGMQITRQVTLHAGGTRVALDLYFVNASNRPRRWSIWDVCQLRADRRKPDGSAEPNTGCVVTAPLNPNSRFPNGYYVMAGTSANPQWSKDSANGVVRADYRWEIGKIGADARRPDDPSRSWIAYSNTGEGYAYAEQFQIFPDMEYPDDGAHVECWTVGRGQVGNLDYERSGIYLMETEVLSPLYTFQPGEKRKFHIDWGVGRSSGAVLDVQPGGCASKRLAASRDGEAVRLEGQYGVFDQGILMLVWLDTAGEAVGSLMLGEVTPNALVDLAQTVEAPAGAAAIELGVIAAADNDLRALGKCEIV